MAAANSVFTANPGMNVQCVTPLLTHFKNKGKYICKSCWSYYSEEELKADKVEGFSKLFFN